MNVTLDAGRLSLSHQGPHAASSGHAVLERIQERFKTRERLSDEIRAILEKQEMAAERLVNYVRAVFSSFSLSAVTVSAPLATAAATKIFTWQLSAWIAYAIVTFFLLRRRDRYYWWLG